MSTAVAQASRCVIDGSKATMWTARYPTMLLGLVIGLVGVMTPTAAVLAEEIANPVVQLEGKAGSTLGLGDTDFDPHPVDRRPGSEWLEELIYGGTDASVGEFPYMVRLVERANPDAYTGGFCGGSLISPSWVLTAGHCIEGYFPSQLDVVVGEVNLANVDPQNRVRVAAIYKHPGYVPSQASPFVPPRNDIALMKLSRPVYINIEASVDVDVIRVLNTRGSVSGDVLTGWGYRDSALTIPAILQRVSMQTYGDATCAQDFGPTYDSATSLCARPPSDATACQGDSGGPLAAFDDDGFWRELGIVSYGGGNCNAQDTTVFAEVAAYTDWIRSTVTEANDAWANAAVVRSYPFWTGQLTTSTSRESWEPSSVTCSGQPIPIDSTVWYELTPTVSGTLFASTLYSDYDTVLIVHRYEYENNNLTPIACSDDLDSTDRTSNVSFDVTAGSPYYIQVAGHQGADSEGSLSLYIAEVSDSAPPPPPPPSSYGEGDLIALVDTSKGQWHLRRDTGSVVSFYYGNPGDYPIMGDWDGDGIRTLGMYRQADGYVYLKNSNSQGVADLRFFFGNPGDVPITGDFNGDGLDTVSIYRPSNQTFYIINKLGVNEGGLGAAEFSYVFGNPGDKPFVGDFDGDGIDTVGLHRESTGLVYFRNSHTQGNADAQFVFGDPGDRLVAGDWNNDGVSSPALFRPSNTTMYFRFSNTGGIADEQFVMGELGWIPVMWND